MYTKIGIFGTKYTIWQPCCTEANVLKILVAVGSQPEVGFYVYTYLAHMAMMHG
jgi:hypothetical protein